MHDYHENHGHVHHHAHQEPPVEGSDHERDIALLAYMVQHNQSHADELRDVAGQFDERTASLIGEAIDLFDQGNKKLEEALGILKEE